MTPSLHGSVEEASRQGNDARRDDRAQPKPQCNRGRAPSPGSVLFLLCSDEWLARSHRVLQDRPNGGLCRALNSSRYAALHDCRLAHRISVCLCDGMIQNDIFKALADPTRCAIFEKLAGGSMN